MMVKVWGWNSKKVGKVNARVVTTPGLGWKGLSISKSALSAAQKKLDYHNGGLSIERVPGYDDFELSEDGGMFAFKK